MTAIIKHNAPMSLPDLFKLARSLATAQGFVPRHLLGAPESIAAAILTGAEIGLAPMESLRSIHVIDGKPTMSAELMLRLARERGVRTLFTETTATRATIEVVAPGDTKPQTMSFSMDDAKIAGVTGKGNWAKYPAAMLRARVVSAAIRAFCPEVLGASGVYESDSGELTGGLDVTAPIEVKVEQTTLTKTTPQQAPKLAECKTFEEIDAWIDRNESALRDSTNLDAALDRIVAHAKSVGADGAGLIERFGKPIGADE